VAKGETPTYTGETPTRTVPDEYADVFESYTFTGWDPDIVPVSGDAVYEAQFTPKEKLFTVQYIDGNGTVLQSEQLTTESYIFLYDGETPVKDSTAQFDYEFTGWYPVPEEEMLVGQGKTFRAQFSEKERSYVITWQDEEGNKIEDTTVKYGTLPTHAGPSKEATAQYTYTFAGWDPEIAAVTGNATYKATYTATVNKYTVKFTDEDGTELQSGELAYGETPKYDGETPAKKGTAQYTYTFAGWDPEIAAVTGNATYKATYTATVNKYTVKFADEDGTELQSGELAYGETPEYTGETPAKETTAQYTYTFAGWDPEIAAVTGNATYKAVFTSKTNEYTIIFTDAEGKELQSGKVAYGEKPEYTGETPTEEVEEGWTCTFTGWYPDIATVNGNATYKAIFSAKKLQFDITFKNGEEVLQNSKVAYDDMPEYRGATPTKDPTTKIVYEFAGWKPELEKVKESVVYEATFTEKAREYQMNNSRSTQQKEKGTKNTEGIFGKDENKEFELKKAKELEQQAVAQIEVVAAEDDDGEETAVNLGEIDKNATDEMEADFEDLEDQLTDAQFGEKSSSDVIPSEIKADTPADVKLTATDPFRAVASNYPATITIAIENPEDFIGIMTFVNGKWVKFNVTVNDDGTVTFVLDQPCVMSIVSQIVEAA